MRSGLIDNQLLLHQGVISRFTFNNVLGIALRLEAFEWAENFVQTYTPHLRPSFREATRHFSRARLAFARKEYQSCLRHLQGAGYDDLFNQMAAKILALKVYFHLEEFDVLEHQIKSMNMFLRRHKNIGYHYKNWRNILKYMAKLITLNPHDRKAVRLLRERIAEESVLTEKPWLLAQL